MINLLISILAFIVLLIGIVSMMTPFPGGILLVAGSISVLICSNSKVQQCIRHARTKYHRFNRFMFWLENKVGIKIKFIGTALQKTHPKH